MKTGCWVPPSLQLFLKLVLNSQLRQESIGRCVVKAAKPRIAIPPILLRFKIILDNLFGSKWLVNELFHLGFSVFYNEVVRYKQAAFATKNSEDMISSKTLEESSFTHLVSDNADQNIATLTGSDIFHGIALLAGTTNKNNHEIKRVAPRRTSTPMKSERIDCRERNLNKILQRSTKP